MRVTPQALRTILTFLVSPSQNGQNSDSSPSGEQWRQTTARRYLEAFLLQPAVPRDQIFLAKLSETSRDCLKCRRWGRGLDDQVDRCVRERVCVTGPSFPGAICVQLQARCLVDGGPNRPPADVPRLKDTDTSVYRQRKKKICSTLLEPTPPHHDI